MEKQKAVVFLRERIWGAGQKGTRMPVSAIFENLEAGANLDDIMKS